MEKKIGIERDFFIVSVFFISWQMKQSLCLTPQPDAFEFFFLLFDLNSCFHSLVFPVLWPHFVAFKKGFVGIMR